MICMYTWEPTKTCVSFVIRDKFAGEKIPTLEEAVEECIKLQLIIYFDVKGHPDEVQPTKLTNKTNVYYVICLVDFIDLCLVRFAYMTWLLWSKASFYFDLTSNWARDNTVTAPSRKMHLSYLILHIKKLNLNISSLSLLSTFLDK